MKRNRWLAVGAIAALGGCGSSALGDSPTIGGRLQDWPKGTTGGMEVRISGSISASGTIDPGGNFSVTLPGASALMNSLGPPAFSVSPPGCTGQISVSPATARSAIANFSIARGKPATLSAAGTVVVYAFFDQDVALSGTLSCTGGGFERSNQMLTVNLNASRGWNDLLFSTTGDSVVLTEPSGALPSDVRWTSGSLSAADAAMCLQNAECESGRCQADNRCLCSNLSSHGVCSLVCTQDSECQTGPCNVCPPVTKLCLAPLGVGDCRSTACQAVDWSTCGPLGSFQVGYGAAAIAFDGTNMWVANSAGNTVTALSPTGATFGTFPVGNGPQAVAFDGTNMWVANSVDNTVSKLSPTGAALGTFPVGRRPSELAFDGAHMWVTTLYSGDVIEL